MPRAARRDDIGAFHHVMNRGLARRAVFESRRDRRYFLGLLARAVRSGAIELHEFTLLSTHFHLLVRSLRGELSKTIGRIAWQYVCWFNRSRGRDGSLFRSRFTSRPVDHEPYVRAVRVYIADNAVAAGLVARPPEYEWCSAHWRAAHRGRRWIAHLQRPFRRAGPAEIEHARFMIEQRAGAHAPLRDDPWRELATASGPGIAAWLCRRARLADGCVVPIAVTSPRSLAHALGATRRRSPATARWRDARLRGTADEDLHRGLLRELCGLSWQQVARLAKCSRSAACAGASRHAERLLADRSYSARVAVIVRQAMGRSSDAPSQATSSRGLACVAAR